MSVLTQHQGYSHSTQPGAGCPASCLCHRHFHNGAISLVCFKKKNLFVRAMVLAKRSEDNLWGLMLPFYLLGIKLRS